MIWDVVCCPVMQISHTVCFFLRFIDLIKGNLMRGGDRCFDMKILGCSFFTTEVDHMIGVER